MKKKQNRIDRNGEMIMASKGVNLDSLDLEDLVERPESNPPKEKEDLSRGAQVELVFEFKSNNSGDTRLCEYTGQLVSSTWFKSANQRQLSIRMSLEYALELSDLAASGASCAIKKLDICYINPPSAMLKKEKEWIAKTGGTSLLGVELRDIANSTALCVLAVSGPLINSDIYSIFASPQVNKHPIQLQPINPTWIGTPPPTTQDYYPPVSYPYGSTIDTGLTIPGTNINDAGISGGASKSAIDQDSNANKNGLVQYLYAQSKKERLL